jgi:hypothetical protein
MIVETFHKICQYNPIYLINLPNNVCRILILYTILSLCILVVTGCTNAKQKLQTHEIKFSNLALADCEPKDIHLDSSKLHQSKAIVKARLLKEEGGSKYLWTTVEIIAVLCNKTNFNFSSTCRIAHYSWKGNISENSIVILYLSPYPFGSQGLNANNEWMLLNGDAQSSVQRE